MFSGIVQRLGTVKKIKKFGEGKRFYIDIEKQKNLRSSYSICISGCCLTVTKIKKERTDAKRQSFVATFDVMPETLSKTYFSSLKEGDKVNIERSLRLGDEIGGHFVSGHVDCVGKILKKNNMKDFSEMTIEFPKEFSHLLIDKGSVAVD
ncbi:MAG TPA: riboflavin synthase, partial [archaeon]|nr:riboflavin synthase [archaeon]